MPKIKTKIKLRYVVFNKEDRRTVDKTGRMLSTTGYSGEYRNGKMLIYSDYGRETITVEDGNIVYVYQFLDDEMVGVMEPIFFYKRFGKEVARRLNKKNVC